MIAGIHQPLYLPWHKYFAKIAMVDIFVILDDVQYPRSKSFFNRNYIKTPNGRCCLTVPIKEKSLKRLVKDTRIDNNLPWQKKHWKSIYLNYQKAKYFDHLNHNFSDVYDGREWEYISDLSIEIIKTICSALHLETKIIKSSELGIPLRKGLDHIMSILKEIDCDVYVTGDGMGSRRYIESQKQEFGNNDIDLFKLVFSEIEYHQLHGKYMRDCAAIDLLFNCGTSSQKYLKRNTKLVRWC